MPGPHDNPHTAGRRSAAAFLERFGPLLALVLLIAGTAIVEAITVAPESRAFLTTRNFANILGQWAFVGIVALGMTFVIILGGIDLSVGSMVALAAGASLYALNGAADAWGPTPAVAVAVAVCVLTGSFMGAINGFVIAKGRLAPFVVTLGGLAIYRSLITAPAQGSEIRSSVPRFGELGQTTVDVPLLGPDGAGLSIRLGVVVFLTLAVIAHVALTRTIFGRRVYAIGDNPRAARYAGVPIVGTTILVYTVAGFTCGVAALLNAGRLNSVSSSSLGLFYELDAIAAVVIGGTRLQGGSGRIFGTVLGVLILGVVSNMLNMLGVSTFYHGLVKGLIIIAAVVIQPRKSDA
ncbi:MAG: ABC transporter permease [Phycisphaerae bacterium]|nr:ABC transporter permease [Phycisphaerae bacterium]